MKLSLITIVLIYSFALYGANSKVFPIGKVTMLRGKVSVLQPHSLKALALKKGDFLYEDSSVLSQKRSFAKIRLINDAFITVGPDSKVVVNLVKKSGATVLGLLKGALRASVAKKKSKHFFVKTRTAAMGVRGTDFLTTFNYKSKKTSLLTYEGSVAIKKLEKKIVIDNEKPSSKIAAVSAIRKLLAKKPVLARVGEFTNVDSSDEKPKQVVKINVDQLVKLKLDETMGVEKLVVPKEKILEIRKELVKLVGVNNKKKTSKAVLLGGGLVDIMSGIYIPPESSKKTIGSINSNGIFIAPKGLKLDATKGFIAINDDFEDHAEDLNQKLKAQIPPKPVDPAYRRYFQTD